MNLTSLTAVELAKKIRAKEVTVLEATEAALLAIEKREKDVHSFVTVDKEGAMRRAKEVQKQIDGGRLTGLLAGVPVAVKDNLCTKDLLSTCSLEYQSCSRRFLRRKLCGGCGGGVFLCAWFRHRRLHPSAELVLRSRRD